MLPFQRVIALTGYVKQQIQRLVTKRPLEIGNGLFRSDVQLSNAAIGSLEGLKLVANANVECMNMVALPIRLG
jgi:hypothetical protein